MPSLICPFSRATNVVGWNSSARILLSEKITAPKLAALIRKAGPVPSKAMTRPATPGPASRARLKEALFRATALGRSSAGTSSETNAWRAGASNALATPRPSARRYTCQSSAVPVTTSRPRQRAKKPMAVWVITSSLRLFIRSASTPAKGPRNRMGRNCRPVVTPAAVPSWWVSTVRTSQSWATRCIQVPMLETRAPAVQSR